MLFLDLLTLGLWSCRHIDLGYACIGRLSRGDLESIKDVYKYVCMYVCVFSYRGPTGIKGCLVVPKKKGEFRDRLRIR